MSPTLPCQLHQYHNEKNFILFYFPGTRWRNVRGKEYNSNQTRQELRVRSSKKKEKKMLVSHRVRQSILRPNKITALVSSRSVHSSSVITLLLLIKCQVTDCPMWRHLRLVEGGTWIAVVNILTNL